MTSNVMVLPTLDSEYKPVLYLVVNKGLNMSPGKVAAQIAHAVMGLSMKHGVPHDWGVEPHRWVIVLEAKDEAHLWSIQAYLEERNLGTYLVVDEGINEIPPLTATVLAVEVLDKGGAESQYLTDLGLYKYQEREAKKYSIPISWIKARHRSRVRVDKQQTSVAIFKGYK